MGNGNAGEVGPLRFTEAVDGLLAEMAAQWPCKRPVRLLAAGCGLTETTVRDVLGRLVTGGLVNPPMQERIADCPPRAVYWLTRAGRAVAAARAARPRPARRQRARR